MKPFSFHRSKQVIRHFYELSAEYMRLHDQLEIMEHPERGHTVIDGRDVPLSDLGPKRLLQLHLATRQDMHLLGKRVRALGQAIMDDNDRVLEAWTEQHEPKTDRKARARGRRARREARANLTRSTS